LWNAKVRGVKYTGSIGVLEASHLPLKKPVLLTTQEFRYVLHHERHGLHLLYYSNKVPPQLAEIRVVVSG